MRERQQTLDGLDVLARHLVVEYVSDVLGNLVVGGTLVHADALDSEGPGSVADRKAKVRVVGLLVRPALHVVDDLSEVPHDVFGKVLDVSKEGSEAPAEEEDKGSSGNAGLDEPVTVEMDSIPTFMTTPHPSLITSVRKTRCSPR